MNRETITMQLLSMVLAHGYDLHEGGNMVDHVIETVKRMEKELFPLRVDEFTF